MKNKTSSPFTSFMGLIKQKLFRTAYIVNLISNIGSSVHSTSEKMLMSTLTMSPFQMTLVDTLYYIPTVLLGFTAGSMADAVDKRKFFLVTQTFLAFFAGVLFLVCVLSLINIRLLLSISFLIGIGTALSMPVYHSLVPEFIREKRLLPDAIAINSISYNLSRVIGSCVGGFVCDTLSVGLAFGINSISFIGVILGLAAWKRHEPNKISPNSTLIQTVIANMKVGFHYAYNDKSFQCTIIWAIGYGWFGSVIFSLVPSFARHTMKLSQSVSGMMMSCSHLGSIISILLILQPLRRRYSTNSILTVSGFVSAGCHVMISYAESALLIDVGLLIAGMSWSLLIATIHTSLQLFAPSNIKARAFGAYQTIWAVSMGFAALFWGEMASYVGTRTTIALSSIGLVIMIFILHKKVKMSLLDDLLTSLREQDAAG